ncbi:MAG: zinc carboxypeptidase, partial [Candidatus Latescibacteria bacterium]|nr:zinc carboxypeptidase [Candidatus Latescibacterota bacterium]
LLQNAVILLDPAFNPDGFNRFAHWANTHRGKRANADPAHREHNEVWPGGRTNHYWFDLNRDWLLLQHPESQGRMVNFHAWKPNVLTDHHEMGTNRTFFFQPGIPSRNNPLTPKRTFELTAAIAERHAEALDNIQSLYYTKESYDDFYIGKGSTYPDLNGSVGILFEQASSRGHIQESIHGPLRFPFTIRNHVRASFSTLKAALELRKELLDHQRTFYTDAVDEANKSRIKAYVFGAPSDLARTHQFIHLLQQHRIQIHELARPLTPPGGQTFAPGSAYVIPTNQPQFRLLTAMFERRTTFQDSLFYDVSAWTLPLAFNMPFAELTSSSQEVIGDRISPSVMPQGRLIGDANAYAYAFEWKGYYAPRALYRLQEAGVMTKVATQPFRIQTAEGTRIFDYGTILIPMGIQQIAPQNIARLLDLAIQEDAIEVYAFETGLATSGISLGSPNFAALQKPEIAILVGDGTTSYNAGEAWHLLDQRYDMDVSLIETRHLNSTMLTRYNTVIMAGGSYSTLDSTKRSTLKEWARMGNTVVAYDSAARWAVQNKFVNTTFVQKDIKKTSDSRTYINASSDRGAQVIGGAIFQVKIDRTHPLSYGYTSDTLPVFRRGTAFLELTKNPYATPFRYTGRPLLSGYISNQNLVQLQNSAAVIAGKQGQGRVILMTDNPTFRAYWYGTQKLLANALFFGPVINNGTLQAEE